MRRTFLILLMASLALSWGAANAQRTYKWIDKDGNISYRDHPPPADSGYRVEERRIDSRAGSASDPGEATEKPPVVLYSVPKCNPCDTARIHLQKRNVPFTEKNAQGDVKVQEELQQKAGALSVPTITIGAKVLSSYAEGWLDSELDQAGYPKAGAAGGSDATEPPGESSNQAPTR